MTDVQLPLLDRVRIASPCPARWDDMPGDDKVRHCAMCNLNVHNIAAMTRAEAEAFLSQRATSGERLCGILHRRADGTIITRDCPVGLAAARARLRRLAVRAAAALGLVAAGAAAAQETRSERWAAWGWSMRLRDVQPFRTVRSWLRTDTQPMRGQMLMGDICLPSPPPPPAAPGQSQFGPRP